MKDIPFICIHFCYKNFNDREAYKKFFEFKDYYKNKFNMEYSRFDYSYSAKESSELKTKSYKYTERNIEKYKTEYEKKYNIISLDFYTLLTKDTYYSNPEFSISFRNKSKINSVPDLYFQMDNSIFLQEYTTIREIFIEFFDYIKELGVIQYGLAQLLNSRFIPSLFFQGIPHFELNESDEKNARNWYETKNKCGELIRGVYYANLLNKKHMAKNPTILKEIEKKVGEENIMVYDDYAMFFLPFQKKDIDDRPVQTDKIRNEIYDLFKSNNMLLSSII